MQWRHQQQHHLSQSSSTDASCCKVPVHHPAARAADDPVDLEDMARRIDIRRATSMRDLRVRTYATERSAFGFAKLYEVEIENACNNNSLHWKLYVWFGDFRTFYNHVKRIKAPSLKMFRKQATSMMLRGMFGDKALCITRILRLLFHTLAEIAPTISVCKAARALLHLTDDFCQMEYPHDHRALLTIRQMKTIDVDSCSKCSDDGSDVVGCCICLVDDDATALRVVLRCGHEFHESCICMWYYSRLNCPVCRQ
ncbi:hypothetical protein H310_03052 [Aphanomyces invadans]|uniref:RING-type domain-containing protein n=1 Tax=Aphanomyces invadans TaxID=157072 RepID=A0A024UKJ8_9STRA|nr:hypothetical protein H310_03052 [Aphanomyces invadans]ETW06941.1 hypothetical protein H310_03052 [Aphanomyces invadans]|eukprot:XP_008865016.1 hypothetical protein H310_03052 [Aphanomyces invadans]